MNLEKDELFVIDAIGSQDYDTVFHGQERDRFNFFLTVDALEAGGYWFVPPSDEVWYLILLDIHRGVEQRRIIWTEPNPYDPETQAEEIEQLKFPVYRYRYPES